MSLILSQKQIEALKLMKETGSPHVLLQGGSRSGKTFLAVYICIFYALNFKGIHILIARLYLSDVRASIINQTLVNVLEMLNPALLTYVKHSENKNERCIRFPNGSVIWYEGVASDERKSEKVLGREYGLIFLSELTQIEYKVYDMLATRLFSREPKKGEFLYTRRMIVDLNPTSKQFYAYSLFIKNRDPVTGERKRKKDYTYISMNPGDNPFLDEQYIMMLKSMSKRQQTRFLQGKWVEDIEGACWSQTLIDKCKISDKAAPDLDEYDQIVIAVDPAFSVKKNSDETGIVICAVKNRIGYVLDDMSGKYSPNAWASKVVKLYNEYRASVVVCETNQGGDIVIAQIKNIDYNVKVIGRTTKKGKVIRADPIIGLYEQSRVKHVIFSRKKTRLSRLEDQMTCWTEDCNYSPDRMDALVYGLTYLLNPRPVPKLYKYDYNLKI